MSKEELIKIDEEIEKLTFSRRRSLVKYYVQKKLKDCEELGKVAGGKSGYFEISTIVNALNDELIKYNLDLDIEVKTKEEVVECKWLDTMKDTENEYIFKVDMDRLDLTKKLQLMVNDIQSRGAILSYFRRYGYIACLGLQATDEIENTEHKNWQQNQNNSNSRSNNNGNKITENQVKLVFGKGKEYGYNKNQILKAVVAVHKEAGIKKVEDMNKQQMDQLIKKMQENPVKPKENDTNV